MGLGVKGEDKYIFLFCIIPAAEWGPAAGVSKSHKKMFSCEINDSIT